MHHAPYGHGHSFDERAATWDDDPTKAQRARETSETSFRAIFDNAAGAIALLSPDGVVVEINRAARDLTTEGDAVPVDLTPFVMDIVQRSNITNGFVQLFVVGSTGAIVSVEFEDGVLMDLKDVFDRLIPRGRDYHHERAWGDGNAHSHLRAAVLGPDMTVPVTNGKPDLGTWQQIAVVNLDNRPRDRTVVVTVYGE